MAGGHKGAAGSGPGPGSQLGLGLSLGPGPGPTLSFIFSSSTVEMWFVLVYTIYDTTGGGVNIIQLWPVKI